MPPVCGLQTHLGMTLNTMVHPSYGWNELGPSPRGERRIEPRVGIDLPVDVLVDGFLHRCRVNDISPTGMAVALTHALALREPRMIGTYDIHLSDQRILHVHARTIWQRNAMQAARFVALSVDAHKEIVEAVCEALRPLMSDVDRLDAAEEKDRRVAAARASRANA